VLATVVDFAGSGREIAVLLKESRKENGIRQRLASKYILLDNAGAVGTIAAEERGATGIAEGVLAVRAVEANAASGETVNVWRVNQRLAVAIQIGIQVIDDDPEDVVARESAADARDWSRTRNGEKARADGE